MNIIATVIVFISIVVMQDELLMKLTSIKRKHTNAFINL